MFQDGGEEGVRFVGRLLDVLGGLLGEVQRVVEYDDELREGDGPEAKVEAVVGRRRGVYVLKELGPQFSRRQHQRNRQCRNPKSGRDERPLERRVDHR